MYYKNNNMIHKIRIQNNANNTSHGSKNPIALQITVTKQLEDGTDFNVSQPKCGWEDSDLLMPCERPMKSGPSGSLG